MYDVTVPTKARMKRERGLGRLYPLNNHQYIGDNIRPGLVALLEGKQRGQAPPYQALKKVFVGKFVKISKFC